MKLKVLFLHPNSNGRRSSSAAIGQSADPVAADRLVSHFRKPRGTFEDRWGEFNEVIGPHLSSREFVENEVTMLLAMLAFNLTPMLRNELEAALGGSWDLHRFQQSVLRAGGRV